MTATAPFFTTISFSPAVVYLTDWTTKGEALVTRTAALFVRAMVKMGM